MTSNTYFPPYLDYTNPEDYQSYEEFVSAFRVRIPSHFNFAYDVLGSLATNHPDKTALLCCNDKGEHKRYSFKEMDQLSYHAACFFARSGIQKGDKVMLMLRRRAEFWFALIGLHKLGAVAVPATHLLTTNDIIYRVHTADIRMIVAVDTPALIDHVNKAESIMGAPLHAKVIVHNEPADIPDGWHSFNRALDQDSQSFPLPAGKDMPQIDDPMLIYFTSGTTGYPKMVSHNFLYPLGHIVTACHWQRVKPGGLHLTLADTGWAKAAWGKVYGQWLAGCGVLAYDFNRFSPKRLLKVIQKHKVTTFCAPPTVYRYLIREKLGNYPLPHLEHCTVAGEPLNPEVYNAFLAGTGLKLCEGYGQTELTLVIGTFRGVEPRPGSMGKPAPMWNVVLLDEEGEECPPDMPGQIGIRISRTPPPGYLINHADEGIRPSASHDEYIYLTGDVARRDADGYFWFIGRNDDIIKSSGYRIGPFEVENALIEHPAVVECAVTGIPDPDRGHAIKATVVLAKGKVASSELVSELQDFVKACTAPYKSPRIIEFVSELPKTISGKIRRIEIRDAN